ncbi:MAG: TolC family protein, partial [Marinicella sp.]
GLNRADLFSIGVTFDLPGFRKNKTNQLVKQKSYELDAIEAAKNKLIKNMYQQLMILLSKQKSFMDQDQLYSENLIPQYKEMAESTVTAYTYEGGDFTAVLRSQLDSLKAQVELNQLITKIKINTMKINLLLMHSSEQFKSTLKSQGARS